ncbi:MAG: inositol monophosphatase [Actinomycetaceae bacterium]|nr:inositol monophosphatase [Actinomycetaceae bacterium]
MKYEQEEIEELRSLAQDIATGLAKFAWHKREDGVNIEGTKSSSVDIVTEADRMIEEYARQRIAQDRPYDSFLGEETGSASGYSGLTWIVDPIDGTVNYAYGIGTCAVSVAVVSGVPEPSLWKPIAGCVAYIGTNDVYSAGYGIGAQKNGQAIHVSRQDNLSQALVGTGFGYASSMRKAQGEVVAKIIEHIRDIRRIGAASTDLCAVAEGSLDIYYESGLKPWDMAAGLLIVSEAGGVTQNINGGPADNSLVIAGNEKMVTALEALLKDAGIKDVIDHNEFLQSIN